MNEDDLKTEAPPGVTAHAGLDAVTDNARGQRAVRFEGVDLDALPARVAAGDHASAFDPLVIAAAVEMRAHDGPGFVVLRGHLKDVRKFPLTAWTQALDAHAREAKAAQKRESHAERRAEATARREASERQRVATALELEAHRAQTDASRTAHYAEAEINGAVYRMQPGRVEMEVEEGARGELRTVVLSNFSAPIVADTFIVDAPETPAPKRVLTLDVQVNDEAPRPVEVLAEVFLDMKWVESQCPGAIVRGARPVREHLRLALQELSAGVTATRRRFGFTGWHHARGQLVYLNAGTVLGVGGAVEGVEARPIDPGDRFGFPPPPKANELRSAARALVDVASFGAPGLMVAALGLAARAVMGPSNLIVHASGEPGFGKSATCGIVQACFGAKMHGDRPPMSWSDTSSPKGMLESVRCVGDAPMMIDDFKRFGGARDIEVANKFDMVTRAVFNGSVPRKLQMDGRAYVMQPPRCPILSTGEVDAPGFSTKDRLVTVHLQTKNPDPRPLREAGLRGDLARAMAGYVVWYASRYEAKRAQLGDLAAEVGARWGLTGRDRAVTQLSAIALGWETLFEFLYEAGAVDVHEHGEHLARACAALREVSAENGIEVEDEHPGRRFGNLITGALRSGKAHAIELTPTGTKVPANAQAWGYIWSQGQWQPRGERVAYLEYSRPGVVFLDPEASRNIAAEQALRSGNPLTVDERALGAALRSAGMLALTGEDESPARRTPKYRLRLGRAGGGRADTFAVKADALGLTYEPTAEDPGPQDAGSPLPGMPEEFR